MNNNNDQIHVEGDETLELGAKTSDEQAVRQDNGVPDGAQEVSMTEELFVEEIVRPHLFHRAGLSGIAIPVALAVDGKPEASRSLYLCGGEDRSGLGTIPTTLELPGGNKLWLTSLSAPSIRSIVQAWSIEGRRAFLAGDTPDPAELFRNLEQAFGRFLYFPDDDSAVAIPTLVLWAMLTYAYPAWSAVPYLAIGGPLGSGKTRVFEILSRVVFRPIASANMTAPCLFRTLETQGGTLLLDEAERLGNRSPEAGEIQSILLSGYKAGNPARRLAKNASGGFDNVEFDVFGPKAIAGIASLQPALESRCIRLMMFRAPADSPVPRRRIDEDTARWAGLRDDLHAFALANGSRFVELSKQNNTCEDFLGRNYELWHPLVALARIVEEAGVEGLVERVTAFARLNIELNADDQVPEPDEIVLLTLANLVRLGGASGADGPEALGELSEFVQALHNMDRVANNPDKTAKELLELLRRTHASLFQSWGPKGVANALRRYGIRPRKTGSRRTYRYITLDQLRIIEKTYSLDLGLANVPIATNAPPPSAGANGSDLSSQSGTSGQEESQAVAPGDDGVVSGGAQEGNGDDPTRER